MTKLFFPLSKIASEPQASFAYISQLHRCPFHQPKLISHSARLGFLKLYVFLCHRELYNFANLIYSRHISTSRLSIMSVISLSQSTTLHKIIGSWLQVKSSEIFRVQIIKVQSQNKLEPQSRFCRPIIV